MHELALRVLMKIVFGSREAAGELVVRMVQGGSVA